MEAVGRMNFARCSYMSSIRTSHTRETAQPPTHNLQRRGHYQVPQATGNSHIWPPTQYFLLLFSLLLLLLLLSFFLFFLFLPRKFCINEAFMIGIENISGATFLIRVCPIDLQNSPLIKLFFQRNHRIMEPYLMRPRESVHIKIQIWENCPDINWSSLSGRSSEGFYRPRSIHRRAQSEGKGVAWYVGSAPSARSA